MFQIHLKFQYFIKKEINELYISNALRSFAMATISVFLPIFFLKRNYSFPEVLFLYLLYIVFGVIFFAMGTKFAASKGAKHSMVLSIPLLIVFFLMLFNISWLQNTYGRIPALVIIGIMGCLSQAIYYSGFHIDFAKFSILKKSAKQVSIIQALGIVFSILGPLFGALIIKFYSFELLFLIIIVVLFISAIPLFFSKDTHEPFKFKTKNIFSKKEISKNLVFLAEGIRDYGERIHWPLFLYFTAINISEIGGLFTFSNAILALFTIYIGHHITIKNTQKIMNLGAIIEGFSLIIRVFFMTLIPLAIIQGIGAKAFAMLNVPFHSRFYNRSKREGITEIIFSREVFLHVGRFFSIAIVAILANFLSIRISLGAAIIAGGLATLFMSKIK